MGRLWRPDAKGLRYRSLRGARQWISVLERCDVVFDSQILVHRGCSNDLYQGSPTH